MLVIWAVVLTMTMFSGIAQVVEDIKLFDVVDLAAAGVNETTGYHSNSKAYEFTDKAGALVANASVSATFAQAVNAVDSFRVTAWLQTPSSSSGGAIASFSRGPGKTGVTFDAIFKWVGDSIEVDSVYRMRNTAGTLTCSFSQNYVKNVAREGWMRLTVHINLMERLIRCKIEAKNGDKLQSYHRYAGLGSEINSFSDYPRDGKLRLAQELLTGSESIVDIQNRFVGKLQDVVISFGDSNCTTIVKSDKPVALPTTTAVPTPAPTPAPVSTAATPQVCSTVPAKDNTCIGSGDDGTKYNHGAKWKEGKWTDCSCNLGKTVCIRSTKRCLFQGKERAEGETWDDFTNCDKCVCKNGISKCRGTVDREYKKNGCPWTCKDNQSGNCPVSVKEGCFCKIGKVLRNEVCVSKAASCPCTYEGKEYHSGGHVFRDRKGKCQVCNCSQGNMRCFQIDGACA